MIEKLGTHLYNKHIFSLEQKEVFVYGMSVLWLLLINWFTVIIVSLIFKTFKATTIFLCLLIPMRKYAGGFHASSASKCFIYSQLILFTFVQLSLKLQNEIILMLFIVSNILCAYTIIKRSPVASKYHPLSKSQIKKYSTICKVMTIIYIFAAIISMIIHYWLLFKIISLVLLLQCVLLLLPEQNHK